MPAPSAIDRSRRDRTCRPIIRHTPFEAMAEIMTLNSLPWQRPLYLDSAKASSSAGSRAYRFLSSRRLSSRVIVEERVRFKPGPGTASLSAGNRARP